MSDYSAAEKSRSEYVSNVQQQSANVAVHANALKKNAPERVKKANQLLKDANVASVATKNDLTKHTHVVERMLHEVAFYPPHDVRKESPAYAKSHDDLVRKQDLPCLACGVKQSTLKDPKQNPFGAVQMETHHHVIEWALANAIDPDKFNARVLPGLLRRNPTKYAAMKKGMTQKQILDWVDHDEDNLWVLCDVHHRHVFVGIHAITYPIWGPQDLVDTDLLQSEIAQAASGKSAKSGTTAAKKPAKNPAKKSGKK